MTVAAPPLFITVILLTVWSTVMGFLKGSKDTIVVKLTVEVDSDNGRKVRVPLRATYKKLPVDEARDVANKCAEAEMTDDDVVDQYLVGWDVKGEDDVAVEFTPENVAEAMQIREYRAALVDGFMQVQFGRSAVNAKN